MGDRPENRMAACEDVYLELRSEPRLLRAARQLVRSYFDDLGFSDERCQEIVLAVDEAFTNAMRHSYGGDTGRRIVLSLRADAEWATLTLHDDGRPAPAERTCRRELETPPDRERLKPGGLGVQLIYRVFDEVCYTPGERAGNSITMRIRRPAA